MGETRDKNYRIFPGETMMDATRRQRLILLILGLIVIRGLIYSILIPYDHAPDEAHHFQLIKAKALQLRHASVEEQRQIAAQVQLTWCYLFYPESCPDKRSLQDFLGSKLPSPPPSSQLYYLLTAGTLNILSLENIRDEVYVVRGLSILCGLLIVVFAVLVMQEIFPDKLSLSVGVPAFMTFIPQFSAMNGVITNDKFAEVFVALMFWMIVKILKNGMRRSYLAIYLLSMGFALLSKRTALFVFPVFLVLLLSYYWKGSLGLWFHLVLIAVFLGIALGTNSLAWYVDEIRKSTENPVIHFLREYLIWVSPSALTHFLSTLVSSESLKYYAKFFIVMYWSFWGLFGYMTIHLHHFWYLLTAFGQALAGCGIVSVVWRVKVKRIAFPQWQAKILYVFGISIFFAVLLPFLRFVVVRGYDPMLPQGRYLFPVLIPISLLTLVGLEQIVGARYHRLVGTIGLIGLLLLDMVSLSKYILLNFHGLSLF